METAALTKPAGNIAKTSNAKAENAGASEDSTSTQVVSFKLGAEEYGITILDVQEVILMGEITQVPQVPDFVRGLINLRGSVIPIIDLRARFDMEVTDPNEHTRIIVVNAKSATVGLIVDSVEKVLRINESQIEPPPTGLFTLEGSCVSGVVKLEKTILSVLDVNMVLEALDDTSREHIVGTA